ncbi:type II toxin-antitoxin system RelE/ParE family toxin [Rhodomicrobium vannielii ATCC 17100]|uniref:type II toxin-antitoxin system RelE/ParE family toxin n=1 Tax=Rhodomicrobium vannielii TaxID=1069 RepID=UPI001918CD9B|nr:type II toxin-antitoxin system RelE/ParE family toxin [Rhodomicrobium vannielii]MBJ7532771.1 type II toxin-antitoxin system RelE/ParE family toxin [Rhodomicrobium vannielii ATCC 17100]
MARYRLSEPAKADIASILRTSEERHGRQAGIRYRALLTAALRRVATEPDGVSTSNRDELLAGIRSFHIRHSRTETREAPVGDPVHVIFYRAVEPGLVEIVRVLHDRMESSRRVGQEIEEPKK